MHNPLRDSLEYKKWRKRVFSRDRFQCLICGEKKGIQAHHIKPFERYPELRFLVSNGITLCSSHHSQMWQKEDEYEAYCLQLLAKHSSIDILWKLNRAKKK